MSYYGHTLPFEHREPDCDCGACQYDDWVEEKHLRHLARQEDDDTCYCWPEANEYATSLRDASPSEEEVAWYRDYTRQALDSLVGGA